MRLTLLIAATLVAAGGCTWVKMGPGAAEVRVARDGENLSSCVRRGEVSVSVKDRLGPVERNDLKVRDELETLARNEAPGMGADTIQAKTPRPPPPRWTAPRPGRWSRAKSRPCRWRTDRPPDREGGPELSRGGQKR